MRKFSKFSAIAVLASSIVSSAAANWYDGVFVGVEGKYNIKSKFETKWTPATIGLVSGNFNIDDSAFVWGLKVGYDFDLWRIYGAYNYNPKIKDDTKVFALTTGYTNENIKYSTNDFILGADWKPKFNLGGIDFKGVLGAFGGISKIDVKYHTFDTLSPANQSADYSQDGFIYGLKLGAIYDLDKFGEVEFGLKFDKAKYDDKDALLSGRDSYGDPVKDTYKISDTKRTNTGVFVGYNYKF